MNYIAIFFTNSGAIKFNRFLTQNKIKNKKIPVPRKLTSNCTMGINFEFNDNLNKIVIDDIEKIFQVKQKNYKLVYYSK